ncbi:MAG: tRNA (adenosine(37)-N6)-threonylcarbamoyltransferase complex dimerization subunit type 1 TsaB [Haliangium ochraceum]
MIGKTKAPPGASLILAIDTSTPVARVAVVDAITGLPTATAEAVAERHSSNLLRLCVEVTERAGVAVAALEAIVCGAGPGSFTGLRVGLAVAKGLAMPSGIPLVLVSSLEALAIDMRAGARPGEVLLPCLDAGKGQVYAALFDGRSDAGVVARSGEWAVLPSDLAALVPEGMTVACAGPGAVRHWPALEAAFGARGRTFDVAGPSAVSVAARGLEKMRAGEFADLDAAVPSYGRPPDITRPKRPPP